jgi:hypothetical protein
MEAGSQDYEIRTVTLGPADAAAVDSALESRARQQTSPQTAAGLHLAGAAVASEQEAVRARRVAELFALLDRCPVQDPPADLTDRALARIAHLRQQRRFARQVDDLTAPPVAFRWTELLAVAAVLMLGLSVLWPMLVHSRHDALQQDCAKNLAVAGSAIGSYANDHDDLPPRLPVKPGSVWWNVGAPAEPGGAAQSNSAHLYRLVRLGYVEPSALACPENANAPRDLSAGQADWPNGLAISYSYQNQFGPEVRLNDAPHMILLGDKNPLFTASADDMHVLHFRDDLPADSPSALHQSRGQNVLRADGKVLWTSGPNITIDDHIDNIWTLPGVVHYTGTEVPAAGHSLLVP